MKKELGKIAFRVDGSPVTPEQEEMIKALRWRDEVTYIDRSGKTVKGTVKYLLGDTVLIQSKDFGYLPIVSAANVVSISIKDKPKAPTVPVVIQTEEVKIKPVRKQRKKVSDGSQVQDPGKAD